MSIYEHLWYIVETESLNSTNSRIAQYILLNYKNIENKHLDDIAYGANVVKSTVSKFFKEMTENGSYDSFLATVDTEKKDMSLCIKPSKKKQNIQICKNKDFLYLSNSIQNASKVIFFTSDLYRTCIRKFCRQLIGKSIVGKTSPYFYKNTIKSEILSLNENDCVIFVNLEKSFYEHILRLGFEIDFFSIISSSKCKTINLSSIDEKISGVRTVCISDDMQMYDLNFLYDVFDNLLLSLK